MSTVEKTRAVPFVDLTHVHAAVKHRILGAIEALIDANAYSNGPQVAAFENAFAVYTGRACCVGISSGLDALRLGLLAAGIEPGDEVVIPANTYAATAAAIVQAGGLPVVVAATETDYN